MFHDDADYIKGMNFIPVSALSSRVLIYAFCLMSNHVHFIICGEWEQGLDFIRTYKRLLSREMSKRYNIDDPFPDADVYIGELPEGDPLRTAIAYVFRNPTAAGLHIRPSEWRWSSLFLCFAERSLIGRKGLPLSEISVRKIRENIHSRLEFPKNYKVDENFMILPECYVKYHAVEKIFGHPGRMLYFLSKNDDAAVEASTGIIAKAAYRDEELLASLPAIVSEMFGNSEYSELSIDLRYKVAVKMHKRYGIKAKQLSRVTGLPPEVLKALI